MLVRHLVTNSMACSISVSHWAGVQLATEPLPVPQKWPLKWVPISWPVQPRRAHLLQGLPDVLVGEVTDGGGADGVVRRAVQALLRLGQQVQPGEEEGHRGVVVPRRACGTAGTGRCPPRPLRPRRRRRTAVASRPAATSPVRAAGWAAFRCTRSSRRLSACSSLSVPGVVPTLSEADDPEGEQPATESAAAAPIPSPHMPRRLNSRITLPTAFVRSSGTWDVRGSGTPERRARRMAGFRPGPRRGLDAHDSHGGR